MRGNRKRYSPPDSLFESIYSHSREEFQDDCSRTGMHKDHLQQLDRPLPEKPIRNKIIEKYGLNMNDIGKANASKDERSGKWPLDTRKIKNHFGKKEVYFSEDCTIDSSEDSNFDLTSLKSLLRTEKYAKYANDVSVKLLDRRKELWRETHEKMENENIVMSRQRIKTQNLQPSTPCSYDCSSDVDSENTRNCAKNNQPNGPKRNRFLLSEAYEWIGKTSEMNQDLKPLEVPSTADTFGKNGVFKQQKVSLFEMRKLLAERLIGISCSKYRERLLVNGKLEWLFEDGLKAYGYPDGNVKVIGQDTTFTVYLYNGDTLKVNPLTGTSSYTFSDSKIVKTKLYDGVITYSFPDGAEITEHLDGSIHQVNADGSITAFIKSYML